MSSFRRFGVGFGGTMGLAIATMIYWEVFQPIVDAMGSEGPFGWVHGWIDTIVPLVILGLLLVLWLWVLGGGVQEERTLDRRRIR